MATLRLSCIGNLQGRVALVTGGGVGLGYIIAKAFASNGAKVYVSGRRVDKLQSAAETPLPGSSGQILPLPMDVTSKESIASAVEHIGSQDKKLNILVNNAGIIGSFFPDYSQVPKNAPEERLGPAVFREDTFESWESIFKTNTVAPFMLTSAFLKLLHQGAKAKNGGTSSVINISSMTASTNCAFASIAYKVSKAGLESVTRALATEYGLNNIPVRVNAIAPGVFDTEMAGPVVEFMKGNSERIPGSLQPIPLKRLGRESELAMVALFLAGAAGGYTNGQVITVDGGLSAVNP